MKIPLCVFAISALQAAVSFRFDLDETVLTSLEPQEGYVLMAGGESQNGSSSNFTFELESAVFGMPSKWKRYVKVEKQPVPWSIRTEKKKISEGTFGEIFKAHLVADKQVELALKMQYYDSADANIQNMPLELLDSEVALMRLKHPHLLPAYAWGKGDKGRYYILMPRATGTYADAAASPELPFMCKVSLASDLLEAVTYLHSLGVIHNDIKPGNVLYLREEGNDCSGYLADFGIASRPPTQVFQHTKKLTFPEHLMLSKVRHTDDNSMSGTSDYWPPTYAKSTCAISHRNCANFALQTDIYATAIVISDLMSLLPTDPAYQPLSKEIWKMAKDVVDAECTGRRCRGTAREMLQSFQKIVDGFLNTRGAKGFASIDEALLTALESESQLASYQPIRRIISHKPAYPTWYQDGVGSDGVGSPWVSSGALIKKW